MKLLFILLKGKHSSQIVVAFTQHAMLYALEVDLLHIWWEGASDTQITYKLLAFVTIMPNHFKCPLTSLGINVRKIHV